MWETKQTDGYVELKTDEGLFRIIFLTPGLVRIRHTNREAFAPEASYTLVMTAWEDRMDAILGDERRRVTAFRPLCREDPHTLRLSTPALRVEIVKSPFCLSIYDPDGVCLHADRAERAYVWDAGGRVTHYSALSDDDWYYGFGEKTGALNKRDRRMRMANTDALGYDGEKTDPLYKHIPFYIRLNRQTHIASGMFYRSAANCVFDMGCERSGYWGRYSYFSAPGELDWFFIAGPSIRKVVQTYTDLTGKTALPPLYTLGYIGSSMYYTELDARSDDAVLGFVEKTRQKDIPCDGFHLSSGYTAGADGKRYVFQWNRRRFPDPAAFVRRLREAGIALSPNIKPGMLLSHPLYGEFRRQGAYVKGRGGEPCVDKFWGGPASFVDFTNPQARALWKRHLKESLIDLGIAAVWDDNCEFEIADPHAVCDCEGEARPLADVRGVLPNLMAMTACRAIRETDPNIRPYILSRAGFAGIQRYAQTWAGDNSTSWKSYRFNVTTMLGMGLCGVANQGVDIGGFYGGSPDPELLVRWIQNAAFYPRFCIHSCNTDNTVTEPWMYPSCTPYIRDALRMRYSLIPYYYSLLYAASRTGDPVMRPLVYEFQQDTRTYDEGHDFMVGPYLLVAGVFEKGARSRRVYLPRGTVWYDWYTHRPYAGGETVEAEAPLNRIPLFYRSGSIIPTMPPCRNLTREKPDVLQILVEPTPGGSFPFYEDDGVSNDYRKGVYRKTDISTSAQGKNITISFRHEGSYASGIREIQLTVPSRDSAPLKVCLDGRALENREEEDAFRLADGAGYYYDPERKLTRIRYPAPAADHAVTIYFDAKDLLLL